jgi:hypothetical protein
MFGKSLVLVVGAGASKEVNLPIGSELKRQIAKALDIRYGGGFSKVSGDDLIDMAFRSISRTNGNQRGDINPYLYASWRIRDAMPQAISIDNFIDAHRSDPKIAICGKLAIVRSILAAESKSPLWIDRTNINNKPNFSALESTWFNAFFQLLTENCRQDDLPARFEKISIICFNYDRCIEHYLHSALQNYYGMKPEEANTVLAHLEIHHPYGTVGKLPWQNMSEGIDFGATPRPDQLIALASELRTFTEGTDARVSDITAIRATLSKANRIAFIGFAFHRLNLQLLFPGLSEGERVRNCKVCATALGISAIDTQIIVTELSNLGGIFHHEIFVRNDLTCSKLFHEYWRSLTLQ